MKVHQISLFMENKPGRLVGPCRALAEAGINILTLSIADTRQFGILRLIVRDWQRAQTVLENAGYAANVSEVIVIETTDRTGRLADILTEFEASRINLDYLYAFTLEKGRRAVMVLRCDEPDQAIDALQRAGAQPLENEAILRALEGRS